MTLCLTGYKKIQQFQIKRSTFLKWIWMFQLWFFVFLMPFAVQDHTAPPWKALRYGKHQTRGLCCCSSSSICQDVLKIDNLLHKQGFVDSLTHTTVNLIIWTGNTHMNILLHMFILVLYALSHGMSHKNAIDKHVPLQQIL